MWCIITNYICLNIIPNIERCDSISRVDKLLIFVHNMMMYLCGSFNNFRNKEAQGYFSLGIRGIFQLCVKPKREKRQASSHL